MTDDEIAAACAIGQQHCFECRVVECHDNQNTHEQLRLANLALDEACALLAAEGYDKAVARIRATAKGRLP
jgi:hypothetical protein